LSSTRRASGGSASGSRKARSRRSTEPTCSRQFASWLAHGFTGCGFAQSFATNDHVLLSAFDGDATANDLDEVFDLGRAPYVALATWAGGHENPHRRRPAPNAVDFLDSALHACLDRSQYKALWETREKRTGALLTESADAARHHREVTFRPSDRAKVRIP
jgi:hypothetical protein